MKKFIMLSICICTMIFNALAQKADIVQAIVHYKFSHLRDTTKPNEFYNENMVLFLGRNASVYKSYDRKLADAMMRKQIADQIKQSGANGVGSINITRRNPVSNVEYYQFTNEKKLVRKERLVNNYLIEEPLPVIDWKITADTMSIGSLHCQKATTHFKGRDYVAWFCPELPFRSGPWKLGGLPGLIVEAYDIRKQVVFKFDGMDEASTLQKPTVAAEGGMPSGVTMVRVIGGEDPNEDPRIVALPANGLKVSSKEFENLRDAMRKDPQAFIQSAMAGQGMSFKPSPGAGLATKVDTKVTVSGSAAIINNPIELPEKK